MMYPNKDVGPQTQTELMAWLFGALAASYNMLAQYEQAEVERESQRRMDILNGLRADKPDPGPRPEPGPDTPTVKHPDPEPF